MTMLPLAKKIPLSAFCPAALDYRFNPKLGGFEHDFDRDLHVFVLWEKSADHWAAIRRDLEARFTLLHVTHVSWTPQLVDDNFLRLYGMAPTGPTAGGSITKRSQAVGGGPFMLLVVEDPAPVYVYDRTFSKKVELVNRNVAQAKARYRALTGGGFKVHSSNSLGEFLRDGTLLLGAAKVQELLTSREAWRGDALPLSADLAGAAGWPSLPALFEHLQRSCRYAVLRNFEPLPERLPDGDGDLDLLCRDAADLAAIANARIIVQAGGKFGCETQVAGQALQLDVRVVGDGYYDDRWQLRMLQAAQPHGGRDTTRVAAVLTRAPVLWSFRRRLSAPVSMAYRAMKKRAWRSA